MRTLEEAVSEMVPSVIALHERLGLPRKLSEDWGVAVMELRIRLSLLTEEVGEYAQALNKGEVMDAALEITDVLYVVLGILMLFGDVGIIAVGQTVDKNNRKTSDTHRMIEGKAIKVNP